MSEQEMKKILQELDHMPMPNKETVLAACEEAFEAKHTKKTERNGFKPIFVKQKAMRIAALAACVCLLITGVFGGLHLFGGENPSAITEQGTPNLPLDQYPPDEVDYANMSMVEYMELFPDFLSYRYMPWSEGYAFAHLEILEAKRGYRYIGNLNKDGTYGYDLYPSKNYTVTLLKCRVIEDAWDVLEPGTEINLFVEDYREGNIYSGFDSVLMRFSLDNGSIVYDNAAGEKFYSEASLPELASFGCFQIEDGKVRLEKIKSYQRSLTWQNYVPRDFSLIESIVAEDMDVETALENMRVVKEKYQTGEYNYLSVDLVSQMTYDEYCRMLEGTLTDEEFDKFGISLMIEYPTLPPLFFVECSLSDGTKFEFCTRVELSETLKQRLLEDIVMIEKDFTKDGKLDAEACIEKIKKREYFYAFDALYGK